MGGTVSFSKKCCIVLSAAALLYSCGGKERKRLDPAPAQEVKPAPKLVETPAFNSDSAYAFVARQVAFGPRVPNEGSHKKCARWLQEKLELYGMEVITQETTVTAYNEEKLEIYNIMGRYNPEATDRIMFCAHWDTRPYADRDNEKRTQPIDGANDGGSGVAVLLELARAIQGDSLEPNIGFDIVFFDGEDYGKPESSMVGSSGDTWCLGSQYWSSNIPVENYKPRFAILLDMVGAGNAVFPKEGTSMRYAPQVVDHVWSLAHAMNYGQYFVSYPGNPIIDDHLYLNQIAHIPSIDVVHYEMGRADFGSFHHTHEDNMGIIDKAALDAVGEVMLQVLYQQ